MKYRAAAPVGAFARSRTGFAFALAAVALPGAVASAQAPDPHNHGAPAAAAKASAAAKAPAAPIKLPSNIAAKVNNQSITVADMLATLNDFGGYPLLPQLIQNAVVEQEAKRLGVSVTPAELKAAVQQFKTQLVNQQFQSGTPMTFAEIAARDGITEGLITWNVRRNLLTSKTFSKTVENSVPSLDNQIKASHLLIATLANPQAVPGQAPPKPLSDEEAKKKIDGIYADITAKKITFEEAAKQFSDDKGPDGNGSAARGGDLGYFPPGVMAKEFNDAAFALKTVGEIAGPIKTQFGYHLIKLASRGADATPAEKAAHKRQQIDAQLRDSRITNQWMAGLIARAKITTNPQVKIVAPAAAAPAKKAATNSTNLSSR